MKQTTHINLGGCAFTIDTDAYAILDEYLQSIEAHLHASDSKEEIMQDIELRMAELFSEHLRFGHMEVINISMVNDIKSQLGSPEVIGGEQEEDKKEENSPEDETSLHNETQQHAHDTNPQTKKKLFRDIDNQKLGGVCAGLAQYFGIDAIWLRLAFTIAFFFYGTGLMTYLLLWFVMPVANSSARRLEMQGIEPTAENIQQEVERQQAEGKPAPKKESRSGCLMALFICFAAFIFFPIILLAGLLIFALVMGIGGILHTFPLLGVSIIGGSPVATIGLLVCLLLVVLVPIVTIIIWIINRSKKRRTSPAVWIIAILLWFTGIIGGTIGGIRIVHNTIHNSIDSSWSFIQNGISTIDDIDEEAAVDSLTTTINTFISNILPASASTGDTPEEDTPNQDN